MDINATFWHIANVYFTWIKSIPVDYQIWTKSTNSFLRYRNNTQNLRKILLKFGIEPNVIRNMNKIDPFLLRYHNKYTKCMKKWP